MYYFYPFLHTYCSALCSYHNTSEITPDQYTKAPWFFVTTTCYPTADGRLCRVQSPALTSSPAANRLADIPFPARAWICRKEVALLGQRCVTEISQLLSNCPPENGSPSSSPVEE